MLFLFLLIGFLSVFLHVSTLTCLRKRHHYKKRPLTGIRLSLLFLRDPRSHLQRQNICGSGGIRTHASEETGALNQRLRPLGHATLMVPLPLNFELNVN